MWKFFTSILIILAPIVLVAQEEEPVVVDSLSIPYKYEIRAGVDMASLIRTVVDDEYTGVQLLGDYRIHRDWYIAAELGTETLERSLERIDFETRGSFIKGGVDYNFYTNWLDMDNMLYAGARLAYANMSQRLRSFTVNNDNTFFTPLTIVRDEEQSGLSALWVELHLGVKVEVLNNLYLTGNVQLKRLITEDEPNGFANLFIPGFGRTFDSSEVGVGYSYGIVYRIPFYKK
ncbi:MAG: DUF6048 family protein [Nonlabens sp.]